MSDNQNHTERTERSRPDERRRREPPSGDGASKRTPSGDGASKRTPSSGETVVVQTTPTVRPTLVRLAVTVVAGVVAVAGLFSAPELLGSRARTNLALVVVQILVAIALVRLLIDYVVLLRTQYVVTDRVVRRHFSLLGRTKTKELPLTLVRSATRTQSRIEYLLGIGSIALNRGLGDVELTAVSNHERVYRAVRKQLTQEVEGRTESGT
jgi:hypothetical protein